ncbi:FixL-related histidine kinase [Polaribacter irgensii 23-P]|uniref:histidine kinase n=1 Tax=Polaribacter irgensii 23-P TaxID=313594 RepID=A4C0E8_9FLAO|nr:PAS domain-containing sensor histidine kinase [Polaribacter irgensii]EAR12891.1 FixL-related histidine kinase [Polaribacter irgensii 23-P]
MNSNGKPTYEELEKLVQKLKIQVKVKQNKDRLYLLLDAFEGMITFHKPSGEYIYCNKKKDYPTTSESIIGKMPEDLFSPTISVLLKAAFKKVKKKGESEMLEILFDLNGEKKWFSVYIYPIKDKNGIVIEIVKIYRDIHPKKFTEEEIIRKHSALLKSEGAYRDVLKASSDLIVVFDKKGTIEFINHASEKFYGLPSDKCIGKRVFDFIHPADLEESKAQFLNWEHSSKNNFHFENKNISASGEIWDTEWYVSIERTGNSTIKITAIIRDITKQNQIYQELLVANKKLLFQNRLQDRQRKILIKSKKEVEESEARFRMLILNMEAGVIVYAPDTSIISNNLRVSEIFGLSDDQIKGIKLMDPIWKLVRKDKSPMPFLEYPINIILQTKNSIKNSIVGFSHPFRAGITWVKVNGYPILNDSGKIKEVVISFIDYTKRLQVLDEKIATTLKLEKNEKRLNHAEALAKVGSWMYYPSTQKAEWSDETFNIWGFDTHRGVPSYNAIAKRVDIEDLELLINARKAASEFGVPYDLEFRIKLPNGVKKTVRVVCQATVGDLGAVFSITGAIIDITKQKLFENAQIKHQRIKAIGEMSSSIAHDFNNSLQQMSGNIEVIKLQKNLSGKTIDRLDNISGIINDTAARVDALQKFGDVENESKNIEPIDFNTLIEESLEQSRPLWKDNMEKKGLCFQLITNFTEIPKFNGHKGELKSAIYNLIKNSIEAMPKGGDISITTSYRDKHIFATFTDTGIGMNKKTKAKVFEPFFSTKGFTLGRGLGMSGVYNTVKDYYGNITVKESAPLKGTTFEISFPAVYCEKVKETIVIKTREKSVLNILWVDDDTMITDDMCELLELMGHRCTVANSGKSALVHLHENNFDVVFTDIGMPEMNGWEFIKQVRNDFERAVKIITVSGWSIDSKVKKEHGIDVVLQKPFTVEKLEKLFLEL